MSWMPPPGGSGLPELPERHPLYSFEFPLGSGQYPFRRYTSYVRATGAPGLPPSPWPATFPELMLNALNLRRHNKEYGKNVAAVRSTPETGSKTGVAINEGGSGTHSEPIAMLRALNAAHHAGLLPEVPPDTAEAVRGVVGQPSPYIKYFTHVVSERPLCTMRDHNCRALVGRIPFQYLIPERTPGEPHLSLTLGRTQDPQNPDFGDFTRKETSKYFLSQDIPYSLRVRGLVPPLPVPGSGSGTSSAVVPYSGSSSSGSASHAHHPYGAPAPLALMPPPPAPPLHPHNAEVYPAAWAAEEDDDAVRAAAAGPAHAPAHQGPIPGPARPRVVQVFGGRVDSHTIAANLAQVAAAAAAHPHHGVGGGGGWPALLHPHLPYGHGVLHPPAPHPHEDDDAHNPLPLVDERLRRFRDWRRVHHAALPLPPPAAPHLPHGHGVLPHAAPAPSPAPAPPLPHELTIIQGSQEMRRGGHITLGDAVELLGPYLKYKKSTVSRHRRRA